MARVTDKAKREEVEMLRNQISSIEKQLQDEKRCRLKAEAKLEVYKQDVLPLVVGQSVTGSRYHLEHVYAGHIGEIVHGRDFQGGKATINNSPELGDIRSRPDSIKETRNELQANATGEDIEELHSGGASNRAELEVSRSDRSTLQQGIRVFLRIAEKTGTAGLVELAKQAAGRLGSFIL